MSRAVNLLASLLSTGKTVPSLRRFSMTFMTFFSIESFNTNRCIMVDFVCPILSILLIACDSAEISSDGSSKITWLAHVKLSPAPALFNGNSKQLTGCESLSTNSLTQTANLLPARFVLSDELAADVGTMEFTPFIFSAWSTIIKTSSHSLKIKTFKFVSNFDRCFTRRTTASIFVPHAPSILIPLSSLACVSGAPKVSSIFETSAPNRERCKLSSAFFRNLSSRFFCASSTLSRTSLSCDFHVTYEISLVAHSWRQVGHFPRLLSLLLLCRSGSGDNECKNCFFFETILDGRP
mmetsp:Transcript_1165/g.4293  ORF Transcript_1165/g.4293 Transcript_1165/m.4293 type:complete len:294 (+) Transcript_1165:57-938(+)